MSQAKKKVVVIGAGISGLSAGCYALMNGYDVEIHEAHDRPGGLCTDWRRKGFVFDGCINWLIGSGPGNGFFQVWSELGALQGRRFHDKDAFYRFRSREGRVFTLWADPDRLERHLLELSPADAAPSRELCRLVRRLADLSFPLLADEVQGPWDKLKLGLSLLPRLRPFLTAVGTPIEAFADRFQDPFLRASFRRVFYGIEGLSLFPLLFTLGPLWRRAAGFPLGGSDAFAQAIAARFRALGGTLHLGSRVERVAVEGGRAVGVVAGGVLHRADEVVAAMDLKSAAERLLGGWRLDPTHEDLFAHGKLTPPVVLVSAGVDRDLSAEADVVGEVLELPEPLDAGGRRLECVNVKNFGFDPSLVPPGKTALSGLFMSDGQFWDSLRGDRAAYRAEKARLGDAFVQVLERRWPGLGARVEALDVATPLTFERYTSNWRGVMMTWNLDGEFRERHGYIRKTLPGLEHFFLASMWTNAPGGLPGAAMAGREVVQVLCARDRRRFVTSTPA